MIHTLRRHSRNLNRTLLGMLVFVWLSFAFVPCVVAVSVDQSNAHEQMKNCPHCPKMVQSENQQKMCESHHQMGDDGVSSMPAIHYSPSFYQCYPLETSVQLSETADVAYSSSFYSLPPLLVTGVLRI